MITYSLPVTASEARYLNKLLYTNVKYPKLSAKVVKLVQKLDYVEHFNKTQA